MSDLQNWMAEHGETDESLSPRVGVSRVQVSRIRRKICRPSIVTALRLEQVTGIPAAKLVMGDAA